MFLRRLRRPANLEVETLRPSLPNLAIVRHEFTKRKPNGLPDSDYNHGLSAMDHELIIAFDVDWMGVPSPC